MQRDPRIFLQDVLDAASSIETYLEGIDELAFVDNEMVQSAVFYQFAIIGEALNNLSRAAPDLAKEIVDLRRATDFRNILTHAYHRVSPELVYTYASQLLPKLKSNIASLLAKMG